MAKGILSINFALKRVPIAGADVNMYVANADRYSTIETRDIIAYAAKAAHVPESDVESAMEALYDAFSYFVSNGHSVQIPELGNFRFAVNAKATMTMEEAGAKQITQTKIAFTPCKAIKELLANIRFSVIASNPNNLPTSLALDSKLEVIQAVSNAGSNQLYWWETHNINPVRVSRDTQLRVTMASALASAPVLGLSAVADDGTIIEVAQMVPTKERGRIYTYDLGQSVLAAGGTYALGKVTVATSGSEYAVNLPVANNPLPFNLASVSYGTLHYMFPIVAGAAPEHKDVMKENAGTRNLWLMTNGNTASLLAAIAAGTVSVAFDGVAQTSLTVTSDSNGRICIPVPAEVTTIKVGKGADYDVTIHLVGDYNAAGGSTAVGVLSLSANGVTETNGATSTIETGSTYHFRLTGVGLSKLSVQNIVAPAGASIAITSQSDSAIEFTMTNAQAGQFRVTYGGKTLFAMTLTAYQAAADAPTISTVAGISRGGSRTGNYPETLSVVGTNLDSMPDNVWTIEGRAVTFTATSDTAGTLTIPAGSPYGSLRCTINGSVIFSMTITAPGGGGGGIDWD